MAGRLKGPFKEDRQCRFCKECFEAYHPAMRFCSNKCREKQRYRNHKKHRQTPEYLEKHTRWTAEYRRKEPWRNAYYSKKGQCKKRGWKFTLTMEWFAENYEKGCAITGLSFVKGERKLGPFSATVDQIKHGAGYTPENCRMVLYGVNALRGNGTDKDMIKIAQAIVEAT